MELPKFVPTNVVPTNVVSTNVVPTTELCPPPSWKIESFHPPRGK